MVGQPVFFKAEGLQRTGSFKARGAMNAALQTRAPVLATHSSGNHGAALAYAAQSLGRKAVVVMPEGASLAKCEAVLRYGAQIVSCANNQADREAALAKVVAEQDAAYVPPFDHQDVILGQATAGLELLQQAPDARAIWVPVGGGGLAAGCLLAAQRAGVELVCAEPELAGDAARSMASGVRQPQLPPTTVADGLRTALGELNFELLLAAGVTVHLVTEAEILSAQSVLMSCLKILVEPSSAVPFAALLKHPPAHPVAVVLTGANLSMEVP